MKKQSISNIKSMLINDKIDNKKIEELRLDDRKGVQQLIKVFDKNRNKKIILENKFEEMTYFEKKNYDKGSMYIAGVDEAGRGPLAGPVVAATVILPRDFMLLGLTDSKLLSETKRDEFFYIIIDQAVSYGISIVDNEKIDDINILEATKYAMKTCLNKLNLAPDHVLIDAVEIDSLPYSFESIIKGDFKSISIAAASIIAKVTRDRLMKELHDEYPVYGFDSNMGYGTKHHIEMLKKHGITPYHRKSFAPVRNNM